MNKILGTFKATKSILLADFVSSSRFAPLGCVTAGATNPYTGFLEARFRHPLGWFAHFVV